MNQPTSSAPHLEHPYDHSHLRDVILGFPKQFSVGWELGSKVELPIDDPSNIIICGMGGSALPADILLDAFDFSLPVYVWRSYGLPAMADDHSLIICLSYSGTTEETLSAWGDAFDTSLKPVSVSVGGNLKRAADGAKLPFIALPDTGIQPRYATGYFFGLLSAIAARVGAIEIDDGVVSSLENTIDPMHYETKGHELAKILFEKVPVIIAGHGYGSVARVWKIKINENAKAPCFFNILPEMNHNELVGYTHAESEGKFVVVQLEGSFLNPRITKRFDILPQVLEPAGIEVQRIALDGETKLEQIWNGLLLGDWTSYYLSALLKQDPTPVDLVERFKALMKHSD